MYTVLKKMFFVLLASLLIVGFIKPSPPTLYLIGDSTVDDGSGSKGLWGWGKFLPQFFDTTKITIRNYAQGGTSTRTFQTNGIWDKKINKRGMWDTVYSKLKIGDYLLIQFGLNDQGPVADSSRARGTLHGIGTDTVHIYNYVTKKNEVVHSFGWYLREFIQQAKSKGVTVIVCSTIPKNKWKDGKLVRGESGFAEWALQTAKAEKVAAIDLNNLVADVYDAEGEKVVTEKYHIASDNTHTTKEGAMLNASLVAKAIEQIQSVSLKKYLLK
jgi:rhamnogalacturonan acetylesterase